MRALQPPGNWRLSTRMAVLSLLLLVVQGISFTAIRAGIERNARAVLGDELRIAQNIWSRLVDQRAAKLAQGAALLAADYGFRNAVSSGDHETIMSALENHGGRIDASLPALLDPRYELRAVSNGASTDLASTLAQVAPLLVERRSLIALVGDRPYQFVMVPMRAPVLVGWVVMGFEVGHGLIKDLNAVSGLHATLVAYPDAGAPYALHSTLPSQSNTKPLFDAPREIELEQERFLVRTIVLAESGRARVSLHLAGSIAEAIRPYHSLQLALAGLTLVGLVLFGLGSAWTARRVTQPLHALVLASERLGRGEYDVPVGDVDRADEIGDLAKAFERMRIDIANHAREIRQLAYWDPLTGLPNRIQFRDAVASGFCLEITESAIMDDPERAEATLNRLAQRGFKLSIDDFGTGYSSLAYLKRLPVDELKIDKSFVMGMERSDDDLKIVRSTIDLAHNLGLSVVAEGVENAAILEQLSQLGCDEAQGYHLSKPLPVDGFIEWAGRWQEAAATTAAAATSGNVTVMRRH